MTFEKMKQGAKRFYAPAVAGASLLAGSGAANAAVTIDVDDVVLSVLRCSRSSSLSSSSSGCARPSKARPTLQQSGGRRLPIFLGA